MPVPFSLRLRLFGGVFALLLVGLGGFWLALPSPVGPATQWPVSPALYDADGRLFHVRLSSREEFCIPVPLHTMGPWLPKIAVAIEDKRFYTHGGVDPYALGRAIGSNIARGKRVSGASTITSQLVRIAVPRPRTFGSKLVEFCQAVVLEQHLSKAQILELYLNRAPLGGPFRGVEAAARGYFGKKAAELSLAEAVTLIAMFKGPTYYRPDLAPERLLERRNTLLLMLRERGTITQEEWAAALKAPIPRHEATLPMENWHFADNALAQYPPAYWEEGGAPLHATLAPQMQLLVEQHLQKALAEHPLDVTAAAMLVDNRTGAVQAYVGNGRFRLGQGEQWVDCGLGQRSPGSALKPFVYLEAVEQGILTPQTLLADSPLSFSGSPPRNFDTTYRGPVAAGTALAVSLNAPAVRVLRLATGESTLHRLRSLGFSFLTRAAAYYGDALVLGGCEVSLAQLATAYVALARQGDALPLAFSTGVVASYGHRVFSPAAAYLVSGMLHEAVRNQAVSQGPFPQPIALKTGTSYGMRDAWACAFTAGHTLVVWFGNAAGHPSQNLVGVTVAAPVAVRILHALPREARRAPLPVPAEVESFTACRLSGRPATPACPETVTGQRIRGVSHTMPCTLHKATSAGIVTVLPPDLADYAEMRALAAARRGTVEIVSPRNGAHFTLNPYAPEQKIALRAEGAQGAAHWFINNEFFARQPHGEPLLWPMRHGDFVVSLVDEEGRTTRSSFSVTSALAKEAPPLRFLP